MTVNTLSGISWEPAGSRSGAQTGVMHAAHSEGRRGQSSPHSELKDQRVSRELTNVVLGAGT